MELEKQQCRLSAGPAARPGLAPASPISSSLCWLRAGVSSSSWRRRASPAARYSSSLLDHARGGARVGRQVAGWSGVRQPPARDSGVASRVARLGLEVAHVGDGVGVHVEHLEVVLRELGDAQLRVPRDAPCSRRIHFTVKSLPPQQASTPNLEVPRGAPAQTNGNQRCGCSLRCGCSRSAEHHLLQCTENTCRACLAPPSAAP